MSKKSIEAIVWVVKAGLFILPVTALIVSGEFFGNLKGDLGNFIAAIFMPGVGDMFFPFITGKNFFFRIVVEVLFALWIFAASFDKKYRPKLSPIFWALAATLLVLSLATVLGVNPYKSFWSNYERMEGLFGHIHLFLYFLVAISVLKTEKDWKWLFHASLFVSILIGLYSIWQLMGRLEIHQGGNRIDATLGNATYLAVYLLFHLFLLIYYFMSTRQLGWKIFYASLFSLHLFLLYHTATRGAILGFLGGLFLFGLIQGFLAKEKKYRIAAVSLVAGVFLAVAGFYFLRDTSFIKESPVLSRFREISFTENATQSRVMLAKMGWQAFKERPIFGWGPENFNVVFSKYYDPRLWRQEPWFDRAHNVVLDWLVSGGILGLLAYLGIFASALFLLWRSYRRGHARLPDGQAGAETALFTGLLAGYFFQNIFVFDQLISHLLFFSVLGFLHFKTQLLAPQEVKIIASPKNTSNFIAPILGVFLVISSLYFLNFKPFRASRTLLNALKVASADAKKVDAVLGEFDKVFALNTFGTGEAREQLASYANGVVASELPQEEKLKAFKKAVSSLESQIAENPLDPRGHLFLASTYMRAGQLENAIVVLNKARELSPTRQQILFLLADIHLNKKENDKALEVLELAYNLDPMYHEAVKNLAVVAIVNNKADYAESILEKRYGKKIMADEQLVNAYGRIGANDKIRDIWKLFVEGEPQNPQYHVSLAAAQLRLGDRGEAILELQKAMVLNPEFKAQGEQIIEEIKAGKNP